MDIGIDNEFRNNILRIKHYNYVTEFINLILFLEYLFDTLGIDSKFLMLFLNRLGTILN